MGRGKRARGFTWVEVLASLFILGATAAMYATVYPGVSQSQVMAANHQQALGLIQHKIDQLRAVGYGRLTFAELRDAAIVDTTLAGTQFRFETVDSLANFLPSAQGRISVADFTSTVRQVTITITWTNSARRQGNGAATQTVLIAKG